MIQWHDVEIRHSLLVAGEKMDLKTIESILKDGIKILWFGSKDDKAVLENSFSQYVDAYFLSIYLNPRNIHLTIADGIGIEENRAALEALEQQNPKFNLKQYEIEHDSETPVVVVQAGAGSGKTFVMNNRLLFLLHTKEDFQLSDVVMMTFTNKATDDIRKKLIELLNNKLLITGNIKYLRWIEEIPQISISTIHSFFRRIIIEIGPILGYGTNLRMSSMIMEKRAILKHILNDRYGDRTDQVEGVLGLPVYHIERLAEEFWKKIENNGMSEYDVSMMEWGEAKSAKATKIQGSLIQIFKEVEEKYNARKRENNAIDTSDIIHEFGRVVNDPRIKEYITSRYKYLFCDEFQDSDDVQIQTIAILDKVFDGNLFVVGDIKQSIYRFRGATDSAFERLEGNIANEFGEDHISEPYSLAKNYRTSKTVLDEIDKIFRKWSDKGYLKYRYDGDDNDVLTSQIDEPGVYKQIKLQRDSEREIKFNALLDKLEAETEGKKKSIMVLARYNWQLQEVKRWCEKAGRPCLIRRRGAFFKSPAVIEFCSLVEAFLYYKEPIYLFNLLRSAYCYKPVDIQRLEKFEGSMSGVRDYLLSLVNEKYNWDEIIDEFRNRPVMSVLCEFIADQKPAIVYGAIQQQNYIHAGYDIEEGAKQAQLDAQQYEADLQKLLQLLAASFLDEFSSLADICGYLRLRINTDSEEEPADISDDEKTNYIQGLTVHSAKGLEFDYVLIPFMNDEFGKNPYSEILIDKTTRRVGWLYKGKGGSTIQNDQYNELRPIEAKEVIGDETRLLYVAMTRAIEGLYCFTMGKRNSGAARTWSDLLPEEKDDAYYI